MDQSYDQAHDDELVKAKELSEEELDAAIAAVEAWEQGGKWDDAAYVRDYLIREEIVQSEEDSPTEEEDAQPDLQQWRRSYDEAAVGIDAIPENQRRESPTDRSRSGETLPGTHDPVERAGRD